MVRRTLSPARARRIAARMTFCVVALQAAMLIALWLDPVDPPRAGTLLQLWWASTRRPSFVLLLAVLTAGPALTLLAWPVRGRHRIWLVVAWAVFLAVVAGWYAHRAAVMLRILSSQ